MIVGVIPAFDTSSPCGQEAKTPVEGAGVHVPSAAFRLKNSSLTHLGEDILIESEVEYPCSPEL